MNFILRGNRTDMESGIPESVPERRVMRSTQPPVVGSRLMTDVNSMGFIATSMFIYTMVYSSLASTNFLTGLGIVTLVTITVLKIYAICHGFLGLGNAPEDGDTEFQLNVPRSITRGGRLQRLRLQLDLVDQEIDDYDYEEVDVFSGLTDQELNALPVLQYRIPSDHPSLVDPQRQWELVTAPGIIFHAGSSIIFHLHDVHDRDREKDSPFKKYGDDELMCGICLEDVESGELVRHLPCLHQFHVGCIDMWLRQKAVCPICKSLVRYYHLLHRTNRGMARSDG